MGKCSCALLAALAFMLFSPNSFLRPLKRALLDPAFALSCLPSSLCFLKPGFAACPERETCGFLTFELSFAAAEGFFEGFVGKAKPRP